MDAGGHTEQHCFLSDDGVITSTHPLSDLSNVLSVLPAGEHVGEGEGLQSSMDQVRFGGLLLILFCGNKTVIQSTRVISNQLLL